MNRLMLLAASAVLLSATAASAAVTESAVNMRSGPGTQYDVITTLPGGARFDVSSCNGGWCQGSYRGTTGFVSASYLDLGGDAPGPVVVAPPAYDDDYYDDPGYYAGPGYFGYYNSPSWRHRHRGHWQGGPRPGRPPVVGTPGRPPVIGRPGRPGVNPPSVGFPRQGVPSRGFAAPRGPSPGFGAPAGMPRGGSPGFGAPAASAPAPAAPSAGPAVGFPGR